VSLTDFDHKDEQQLEQLVQSTRWGEVEDARQRVVNRLEAIDRLQFEGNSRVSGETVSVLMQRSVQLYVQQVETILDPIDGDTTDWWDNNEIGQFELPDGRSVDVVGLSSYLALDEEITYTTTETYKPHAAHVGEERTVERTATPPIGLHRSAFRATNRGLADQGVDFDTHSKDVGEEQTGKGNAVSP
jgi:hypothetical protein